MNTQQTANIFFVLALTMFVTACGRASQDDIIAGNSSVTLDFPGISSDLRKKVKLVYNLSCAKEKSGIRAATPATATDESPDPAKVSLKFKASDVAVDQWCALEVMAEKPADLVDSDYRWLSKQKKVGLFYASEATQVSKSRRLDMTMHVLFEKSEQLDLAVDVTAKFDAMALTGIDKANLVCGGVSYPSDKATDDVYKFNLVKKDFDAGQKCVVRLDQDGESFESAELTVKSDKTEYTASFTIDKDDLRVTTKEGSKCAFDTETLECIK